MEILAVIGLCSLIFLLIYICFRIFIAIISTFVYLTGLATVLLFVVLDCSLFFILQKGYLEGISVIKGVSCPLRKF